MAEDVPKAPSIADSSMSFTEASSSSFTGRRFSYSHAETMQLQAKQFSQRYRVSSEPIITPAIECCIHRLSESSSENTNDANPLLTPYSNDECLRLLANRILGPIVDSGNKLLADLSALSEGVIDISTKNVTQPSMLNKGLTAKSEVHQNDPKSDRESTVISALPPPSNNNAFVEQNHHQTARCMPARSLYNNARSVLKPHPSTSAAQSKDSPPPSNSTGRKNLPQPPHAKRKETVNVRGAHNALPILQAHPAKYFSSSGQSISSTKKTTPTFVCTNMLLGAAKHAGSGSMSSMNQPLKELHEPRIIHSGEHSRSPTTIVEPSSGSRLMHSLSGVPESRSQSQLCHANVGTHGRAKSPLHGTKTLLHLRAEHFASPSRSSLVSQRVLSPTRPSASVGGQE